MSTNELDNWTNVENDILNHFNNEQCYIQVMFNGQSSEDIPKIILPIYPEDVTFSGSTNYTSGEMLGRPGTIAGYVSTSDVTSNFSFHLHRELEIPGNIASDKNGVDRIVSFIQACAYPRISQVGLKIPIVTYKFGDTLITGKQMSWNVKWSGPKIEQSYMDCVVSITVTHVPTGIIYFDDIYNSETRQFN